LADLIDAVVTVTDGDDDVATSSVGIGDQILFEDDGPTLDPDSTKVKFVTTDADGDVGIFSFVDATAVPNIEPDGDDVVDINFDPGADDEGATLFLTSWSGDDDDFVTSNLAAVATMFGLAASDIGIATYSGAIPSATDVTKVVYYLDTTDNDTLDGGEELFTLEIDQTTGEYTFEVNQDPPAIYETIAFTSFGAGSPQETLTATASGVTATFDGLLFEDGDTRAVTTEHDDVDPDPPHTTPWTGDDLNPDNLGFGVKDGAASNIDNNEGFEVTFSALVDSFSFQIDQQGNTDDVVIAYDLFNTTPDPDPMLGVSGEGETIYFTSNIDHAEVGIDGTNLYLYTTLPTGNNDVKVTFVQEEDFDAYVDQIMADPSSAEYEIVIAIDGAFDEAIFKFSYPIDVDGVPDLTTTEPNESVRIEEFSFIEQVDAPDVQLAFTVEGTDGDGDSTGDVGFTVGIDGDDDGLITV
jgi:hypothetical protein